jgi:uncharacterized protein YbjT (DUF2867 family)
MPDLTVFVTGATGSIGSSTVRLLARTEGIGEIRVGTRDEPSAIAEHFRDLATQATIKPYQIDPSDQSAEQEQALTEAFAGCASLIVIAPLIEGIQQWHEQVANAAVAAEVPFVVKSSVTGAREPNTSPPPGMIPLSHWRGEQALRDAGLNVVAIRPTIFMQHFLTVPALYTPGDDRFYLPSGDGRLAFLDNRDIGRMAVDVTLMSPEERRPYIGNGYELTGPTALTGGEIAEILSKTCGRHFTHVSDIAEFSAHAAQVGVMDTVKNVYAEAADGWFAAVEYSGYENVTGQTPTTFAQFVTDNIETFEPRL